MAERVAVFVDAGYLFAQGSSAIAGSKRARTELILDPGTVIAAIKVVAAEKAPHCRLLRIYWYDGASGGLRPTADQALLAQQDDVKLRLGFINSHGQQKGVDSLIVTDLIELARLTSICDAVMLSGDEDVRIGVQIAQNYGVRVHLLGIAPSRGSQSPQLIHEADTTSEWGADVVSTFLSVRTPPQVITPTTTIALASKSVPPTTADAPHPALNKAVIEFVDELKMTDLLGISAYWEEARGVPSEFDRRLLPCGRTALGRDLDRSRSLGRRFNSWSKIAFANRPPAADIGSINPIPTPPLPSGASGVLWAVIVDETTLSPAALPSDCRAFSVAPPATLRTSRG